MAFSTCEVRTNRQQLELARHGTGLFPIACYQEDLARESVPWPWHPELEIGVILKGTAVITAGAESFVNYTGWYTSANAGMGVCLMMAEEMQGYILTDKATFLTFQANGGIMN